MSTQKSKSFNATVARDARQRLAIPVPFDPDEIWGAKNEHRVSGTIGEVKWRGSIGRAEAGFAIVPGPAWWRDCDLAEGSKVKVSLSPEGPQREDLAPDLAAALDAEPAAGKFFDSLAQFYRKAYLRWIDATKGKPDVRAARIAEVVGLLKQEKKERPR